MDVYPEPDKLGKQFKYASARNAAFVVVVGSDERDRGEVTIKDMKTGEQQSIGRADIATFLRSQLDRPDHHQNAHSHDDQR